MFFLFKIFLYTCAPVPLLDFFENIFGIVYFFYIFVENKTEIFMKRSTVHNQTKIQKDILKMHQNFIWVFAKYINIGNYIE